MNSIDRLIRLGVINCFGGGGGGGASVSETATQGMQASIDTQLWQYYQQNYQPLVDKYAAQVTNKNSQDLEAKNVGGKINAAVMKNVNPMNVSANPVANAKRLSGVAGQETVAQMSGAESVAKKTIGDVQNVINIGRGQATTATTGIGQLASESLSKSISDTEIQQQSDAATENALGSLAGIAAAGWAKNTKKA